jgi:4-diphosphocytidyl-2C-methyl-D-erythritol kinase
MKRDAPLRRLLVTVLFMEAIVIGLAIPVAIQIGHLVPHSAGIAGGVAAGAAVLFAILARPLLPATLVGGSVLQVFVIIAGAIVPVMYFLGAIFAALWVTGIWLGYRIRRTTAP